MSMRLTLAMKEAQLKFLEIPGVFFVPPASQGESFFGVGTLWLMIESI